MRVLSVIHGPTFGGTHNQLLRLHGPLQARGFETIAVLPAEADAAAARIEAAGVEVHRERLGRLRASADPRPQIDFWRRLPGDVRRLAELVSRTGAEVAQVHGIQNPQGAIAARRRGAAVVWQLPDTRAPMALRRALMPIVTRHADAVVSWGARVASEHPGAERFGERLVIVYPPVDPVEFASDADARRRGRDRLGVDEGRPLVGTVGVRNPHKGHLDLVRAAAIVRRHHPEAAFRILGAPSPAHPTLDQRLAAEAARLGLGIPDDLDLVDPGTEVASLIQALDVFVISSPARSEGMPTAILEAMAAAKPVVATDVGSTAELVVENDTGLLVAPGRPALTAAAIARLLDDAALRSAFGDAGRRRALAAFDLDDLADRHAHAYEIALAHGRGRGRRR